MARRQQRRPAFRPPPGARNSESANQAAIEAGASQLLATHDTAALQSLIHDLRMLRDEADQNAYDQPSSEALRSFRQATQALAEAERALSLTRSA